MRQRLPESVGYPLVVNDIGRTVHPGDEFEAPLLVPGCESLEPDAEDTAAVTDGFAVTQDPADPPAAKAAGRGKAKE